MGDNSLHASIIRPDEIPPKGRVCLHGGSNVDEKPFNNGASRGNEKEMPGVEEILSERGKTHGDFVLNSLISQSLKEIIQAPPYWNKLDASQKEALDMICHKISRIIAGNSNFKDHWDDIAGYATLVSKDLK